MRCSPPTRSTWSWALDISSAAPGSRAWCAGSTRSTSSSIKAMIEFRNVSKSFGPLKVLADIDLRIEPGEVVVVCGPSGSGKSTLLRCINRLEPIDAGEIIVNNVHVDHATRDVAALRAEIGFVFQRFNLYPHLRVLENLTLAPMRVRRMPRA